MSTSAISLTSYLLVCLLSEAQVMQPLQSLGQPQLIDSLTSNTGTGQLSSAQTCGRTDS